MLDQIKATMTRQGVNYEAITREFGMVEAYERRGRGERFSLRDHVRGLLLSQLSNNRPWGAIARNRTRLDEIFFDYDPEALKAADPAGLVAAIKGIRCGNRAIVMQLSGLRQNIETLERTGDIDAYVASKSPKSIAREFASGRKFKLVGVGYALALEYLRNVGINAVKPDVHICRMIGPERLGLMQTTPTPAEAYEALMRWSEECGENPVYVDNLLWLFAAKDYGAICAADPRCDICLVSVCNRWSSAVSPPAAGEGRAPRPASFSLSIGGFPEGHEKLVMREGVMYHVPRSQFDDPGHPVATTSEAWEQFGRQLDELGVFGWQADYVDFGFCDGTQWDLVLDWPGLGRVKSGGSNQYPPAFDQFLAEVRALTGNVFRTGENWGKDRSDGDDEDEDAERGF
jgi:hypothetical protein